MSDLFRSFKGIMKIKTLLLINVLFSIFTIVLIGLVIFWSEQQMNAARENEMLANSVVKGVIELRALAYDYSMHHEDRSVAQWQSKLNDLNISIAGADFEDPDQKAILHSIRKNLDGANSTFFELVTSKKNQRSGNVDADVYLELENRLVSLLLVQSQRIVFDAFQLSEISNIFMDIAKKSNMIIVIFSLIFAAIIISVSILILRSIVKPLSILQQGAIIIGNGDLDHRVNVRSYDEINELSNSFNQMTGKLKERTIHLESAITELEGFAHSASHDLRTPLRGIDGFSKALLEDYGNELDETAKDYLDHVRAAAQKMSDIIDAMLDLSRITRKELQIQRVDLSALAKSIAYNLKIIKPERKVEFVIADDITAQVDPQMIEIVLRNLLGNAWKFTGRHSMARIEFGTKTIERKTVYFISDDGAGFDMVYADKLFKPFERLHTDAEFPGTGIGLATVRRIILRHGGTIWAEGNVENGAVFYFTL